MTMNTYELSRTIISNPKALGLGSAEILIIKAAHRATGATYGHCFLELVAEEWDLGEACRNICHNLATN
jgi:hypothetical protein